MSRRSMLTAFAYGALVASALANEELPNRKLSNAKITGYEPGSDVVSHSLLDLDQKEMEEHLKAVKPDFPAALKIYELGANSGARAKIFVGALGADAMKNAPVRQGTTATGIMYKMVTAGATEIVVTYKSVCKEGGTASPDTSGCFTATGGAITIDGVDVGSPTSVQNYYRTLAGFSTAAEKKMTGQEYFDKYHAYYKRGDYGNQMVLDALDGSASCKTCDDVARVEISKKSSVYMNVWMYVIREMEDAIIDCKSGCLECNMDPVHAWDEAVAFYSGSLEGLSGNAAGKMLYRLAEKRCKNYGTCDNSVNTQIMVEFAKGRDMLLGGKCAETPAIKRRVVSLMSVPLVQGSLRYAYKVDKLSGGSKERAEGHVFSHAIVPLVASCNAEAGQTVANNMAYAAEKPMWSGFAAVKQAFESVYPCLGITCEDMGGLLQTGNEYYEGAGPCGAGAGAGSKGGAGAGSKEESAPGTTAAPPLADGCTGSKHLSGIITAIMFLAVLTGFAQNH